jgi:hypothetical protein
MNFTLGEFGLLDIITILNYYQNIKQNKQLKKSYKVALMIALAQEQDQHEIVELLKDIRNGRKN